MANIEEAPWSAAEIGGSFRHIRLRPWVHYAGLAIPTLAAAVLMLLAADALPGAGGAARLAVWPLWALVAAAIALGAWWALALHALRERRRFDELPSPSAPTRDPGAARRWLLALVIILAMLLLLGWGVYAQRIDPVAAALVLLCGSVTVVTGLFAAESLGRGESPRFESHWGGLGSGAGGWRLSPNATLILLSLIFLSGAFAAASLNPQSEGAADPKAADPKAADPRAAGPKAAARAPAPAPRETAPAVTAPPADGNVANPATP